MAKIKAPFNFVPLNDKVFFPDWADKISQDEPFEDGLSGFIEVKITAKTRIFVRNGHTKEDATAKNDHYTSFSRIPDDMYFIPATSIKGELRNLIEIMSFGKMNVGKKRYAIRDLQLGRVYTDHFVYEKIHCGWMSLKDEKITISDRGIPYRVSHEEIDSKLAPKKRFCKEFGPDSRIKDENKSAQYKYTFFDEENLFQAYAFKSFRIADSSVDKRMGVKFDPCGDLKGKVVFTGQPGPRKPGYRTNDPNTNREIEKKSTGKFWEFVFPEKEIAQFKFDWYGELMEDFKFIYKDSGDWVFWKKKLENGGQIPVFFSVENECIKSIGISYLYKLPFDKRIDEMLTDEHRSKKMDLAECIFGGNDMKNALRGRVHVSNAWCVDPKEEDVINPYMSSPKPTYYPIYLQQNGKNGYLDGQYTTMLNKSARIKGRKMYPVRRKLMEFGVPSGQEINTSPAKPLGKDSVFKFTIHYHNLRRSELGALISALELRENCCHSLGAFKPYGYGACVYSISSEIPEKDVLKKSFQDLMEGIVDNYTKSRQMVEFWSMLNMRKSENLKNPLEYMELKDFVDCKRKKNRIPEYLPWYSELVEYPEDGPSANAVEIARAKVSVFSGQTKQAALLDGKNAGQNKPLEADKIKLKIGDSIEVVVVRKGGNIQKLVFNNKL